MRLKIIHETEYRFGKKVFLEPHYLRFKPKTSAHLTIESFELQLKPEPAGIKEVIDIENNLVNFSWFDGIQDKLSIRSESMVMVSDFNPFHFILHPTDLNNLPLRYEEFLWPLLKPVLDCPGLEEGLVTYCQRAMKDSGSGTVPFLSHLTRQINSDFEVINRQLGPPYDPEMTFKLKKGSCRDLAWMQIHMLRHIGIAARFVSGYLYLPTDESEFELHAWVEVFLPGAGWFGLDPSQGMIVDNTYIPVVASAHFENTMPVTGNFRGTDATSDMTSTIQLELM